MKSKVYAMALILSAGSFLFFACSGGSTPKASTEQTIAEKAVYTCEMHPEVVSDKPGKCPKCGMELIKKVVPDSTKVQKMDSVKK